MKQGHSHITFLLDRSGSMNKIADDVKGGFDAFIKDQQGVEGSCTFTLVTFDDKYEVVHDHIDIQNVPPLNFQPRGRTALNDAFGRSIVETGEYLSSLPEHERPDSVTFVVFTDGKENASREFSLSEVKEKIEEQTNTYSWQFLYLGANQDAMREGASRGIKGDSSLTYDTFKTSAALGKASAYTTKSRHKLFKGISAEDRQEVTA